MKAFALTLLLALAANALLPLAWLATLSVKERRDALESPPVLVFRPTTSNFKQVFADGKAHNLIFNSLIIAGGSTLLALACGVPFAYHLSRARKNGRRAILLTVLGTRMLPAVVIGVPVFVFLRSLSALGSIIPLIVIHAAVNVSLVIWLMVGFFDEIPDEYEEAAFIDGDSATGVLRRIMIPLALPGVGVSALFAAIASWNELFFMSLLATSSTRSITAAIPGLVSPQGTYWGQVAAMALLSIIPVLICSVLGRRFFVRAFTYGLLR